MNCFEYLGSNWSKKSIIRLAYSFLGFPADDDRYVLADAFLAALADCLQGEAVAEAGEWLSALGKHLPEEVISIYIMSLMSKKNSLLQLLYKQTEDTLNSLLRWYSSNLDAYLDIVCEIHHVKSSMGFCSLDFWMFGMNLTSRTKTSQLDCLFLFIILKNDLLSSENTQAVMPLLTAFQNIDM